MSDIVKKYTLMYCDELEPRRKIFIKYEYHDLYRVDVIYPKKHRQPRNTDGSTTFWERIQAILDKENIKCKYDDYTYVGHWK